MEVLTLVSNENETFSEPVEKYVNREQTLSGSQSNSSVSIKWMNWFFLIDSIDCLKHVLQAGRIAMSTKAVNMVGKLQHCTNSTKLKFFHIQCRELCWLMPNFAYIATAQNGNLEKNHPFRSP